MTSQFQHILDLIRQSELSLADKAALEKALKEADKAFEITNFKLDRTEKVKHTTAVLLEETIAELEQKRKAVEAQNRELEIETAVERVRAEAMAMHSTEDFGKVAQRLLQQVQGLGIKGFTGATIYLVDESEFITGYDFSAFGGLKDAKHQIFRYDANKFPHLGAYPLKEWKKGTSYFELDFDFEILKAGVKELEQINLSSANSLKEALASGKLTHQWAACGRLKNGFIAFDMITPPNEDVRKITIKMSYAFDQAYIRFLDLQKAEAQARESQIQLALERVRARTMAMHKSEELAEVAVVLYHELKSLGVTQEFFECGYVEVDEANNIQRAWSTRPDGSFLENPYYLPLTGEPVIDARYEAWKQRIPVFHQAVGGEQLLRANEFVIPFMNNKEAVEISMSSQVPDPVHFYCGNFSHGYLNINCGIPLSLEAESLLGRFTGVFEMTYKRFLDLQKAEAQARESQIEAALEKIRSRSLAMHKSDELKEVVIVVFKKLKELGLRFDVAGIQLYVSDSRDIVQWVAAPDLITTPVLAKLPYSEKDLLESQIIRDMWSAKEQGKSFHNNNYSFKEKNLFFLYAARHNDMDTIPADVREFQMLAPGYTQSLVAEMNSALWVDSYNNQTISADEYKVLERCARVFEQAYIRFLDLQKAETQARESQIQLALERVRAKTMAMQSSNDLLGVANVLREQMGNLGQPELESSIVHLYNDTSPLLEAWYAFRPPNISSREIITGVGIVPKECSAWSREVMAKYNSPETEYTIVASGEKLIEWYRVLEQYAKATVDYDENGQLVVPEVLHYHFSKFSGGALLMISNQEPSAEARELQRRAAVVFDLAYTRFLDLKKAEAQAREAKIEAALEKVRSRSLAMHNSNELSELVATLFDELIKLDLVLARCIIWILNDDKSAQLWMANSENKQATSYHITGINHSYYNAIVKGWQERNEHWVYELKGAEKKSIDQILLFETELRQLPEEVKQGILSTTQTYVSGAFNKFGLIEASGPVRHSEEQLQILHRFNKVFEQSYTRFLDLQKAEAQAREAQIEAGLERVRSKTMAMHASEELLEVIKVVSEQFQQLGFKFNNVSFAINNQDNDYRFWLCAKGVSEPIHLHVPYINNPMYERLREIQRVGIKFYSDILTVEENKQWIEHLLQHTDSQLFSEDIKEYLRSHGYARSIAITPHIWLIIGNYSSIPYSEGENEIIKRFGAVFEQSYTRFLDLQKAEAQAREAQIEAVLERIRSRSMGMQRAEDLRGVVKELYVQLKLLGFKMGVAAIQIIDEATGDMDIWMEGFEDGYELPERYHVPYFNHPAHNKHLMRWKSGEQFAEFELSGIEKNSYDNYFFNQTDFARAPEQTKVFMMNQEIMITSMAYMKYGAIGWAPSSIDTEQTIVLQRVAKVFEQTYTRFLDLQKAEAQAREAKIEAALERVRSKTMAMHNSNDVGESVAALFDELNALGVLTSLDRCGIGIMQPQEMMELWTAEKTTGKTALTIGHLDMQHHPLLRNVYQNWLDKKETYQYILEGEDKLHYYEAIRNQANYKIKKDYYSAYEKIIHTDFFFKEGCLYVFSLNVFTTEASSIFIRFANVFGQTYRRYLDLQIAEAQAREAIKQSSIDRVRGEIASMRTTADLDRITPLIWKELTTLGIPFIRCGVFIMDESENKVHTYLSTPEGKAIAAYHTPMDDSGNLAGAIDHWRQQKVFVTHWVESDFQTQAEVLLKQGSITSREQYLSTLPKGGFHLHFLPFRQGMLYVGSHESFPSEVVQLVQSLADAFSVAYARYEDFTRLESAKAQIEKTLTDLKQTQTQLIQSEKMASLGELTAGIAHEIQNPLNFVNNFSEVSAELIEEMKEELAVGNQQLAMEIATDLKQNLEKINHHGKRADGIVKSMLQHSRKSNNQKELTDINALCDEYLRLSYHGLRAKDKSFNAKFEMQCDPELPKLNVLPQDVGRVILNLINNAFYAVSERQKLLAASHKLPANYEPTVTVTTRNLGDKVEISVKDNGTGIPAKVKEKIFQPFFTTKPTGQGTGLGLSLSYDIITKGHGGEIKLETKEGEWTEFTIVLPIL